MLSQFHTREKKTTPADFRAPKKPPFYISVSQRGDPTPPASSAEGAKTAKHVYLSTQLQFHFERLWTETLTLWSACCLAAFKENNVWFIFFLLIFPLCLGLPFPHLHSDKRRWNAVWLSNGCIAFKNTRSVQLHFDTQEVWHTCISFRSFALGTSLVQSSHCSCFELQFLQSPLNYHYLFETFCIYFIIKFEMTEEFHALPSTLT